MLGSACLSDPNIFQSGDQKRALYEQLGVFPEYSASVYGFYISPAADFIPEVILCETCGGLNVLICWAFHIDN